MPKQVVPPKKLQREEELTGIARQRRATLRKREESKIKQVLKDIPSGGGGIPQRRKFGSGQGGTRAFNLAGARFAREEKAGRIQKAKLIAIIESTRKGRAITNAELNQIASDLASESVTSAEIQRELQKIKPTLELIERNREGIVSDVSTAQQGLQRTARTFFSRPEIRKKKKRIVIGKRPARIVPPRRGEIRPGEKFPLAKRGIPIPLFIPKEKPKPFPLAKRGIPIPLFIPKEKPKEKRFITQFIPALAVKPEEVIKKTLFEKPLPEFISGLPKVKPKIAKEIREEVIQPLPPIAKRVTKGVKFVTDPFGVAPFAKEKIVKPLIEKAKPFISQLGFRGARFTRVEDDYLQLYSRLLEKNTQKLFKKKVAEAKRKNIPVDQVQIIEQEAKQIEIQTRNQTIKRFNKEQQRALVATVIGQEVALGLSAVAVFVALRTPVSLQILGPVVPAIETAAVVTTIPTIGKGIEKVVTEFPVTPPGAPREILVAKEFGVFAPALFLPKIRKTKISKFFQREKFILDLPPKAQPFVRGVIDPAARQIGITQPIRKQFYQIKPEELSQEEWRTLVKTISEKYPGTVVFGSVAQEIFIPGSKPKDVDLAFVSVAERQQFNRDYIRALNRKAGREVVKKKGEKIVRTDTGKTVLDVKTIDRLRPKEGLPLVKGAEATILPPGFTFVKTAKGLRIKTITPGEQVARKGLGVTSVIFEGKKGRKRIKDIPAFIRGLESQAKQLAGKGERQTGILKDLNLRAAARLQREAEFLRSPGFRSFVKELHPGVEIPPAPPRILRKPIFVKGELPFQIRESVEQIEFKRKVLFLEDITGFFEPKKGIGLDVLQFGKGKRATLIHEKTHELTSRDLRGFSRKREARFEKDFSKLVKKTGRGKGQIKTIKQFYPRNQWDDELAARYAESFSEELTKPTTSLGRFVSKSWKKEFTKLERQQIVEGKVAAIELLQKINRDRTNRIIGREPSPLPLGVTRAPSVLPRVAPGLGLPSVFAPTRLPPTQVPRARPSRIPSVFGPPSRIPSKIPPSKIPSLVPPPTKVPPSIVPTPDITRLPTPSRFPGAPTPSRLLTPFRPRVPPPTRPLLRPRRLDRQPGFIAQAREIKRRPGGKVIEQDFVNLNKKPLSRNDALSLMARAVDQSAAATGRVVPTQRPAQQQNFDSYWQSNRGKFRRPMRKGKVISQNKFIERRAFRIDHPNEIAQITVKGWQAQRKRGRIF